MGAATFRRYRAMKARQAAAEGRTAAAAAFEAKRRDSPGTPLPEGFINARTYQALTEAAPVPYDCYEDLVGVTAAELERLPGIGRSTAEKIVTAVEAWEAEQAAGA